MARSDGVVVLTIVLWGHDGIPVARVRASCQANGPDGSFEERTAVGRTEIVRIVDRWIAESGAADQPNQRDEDDPLTMG